MDDGVRAGILGAAMLLRDSQVVGGVVGGRICGVARQETVRFNLNGTLSQKKPMHLVFRALPIYTYELNMAAYTSSFYLTLPVCWLSFLAF